MLRLESELIGTLNREGSADRPRSAEARRSGRVIVIGPICACAAATPRRRRDDVVRDSEARLEEATGLARAIDLTVADALIAPISQIRPATYLGKGKVEEITGLIAGHDIELVVMDCALSPIQQRNLEKAWNTKVLDRTGADPGNLRPPRQDQGGLAAGRARASQLSAQPAGAVVDPSGAPARRVPDSWAAPARPRSKPTAA